MKISKKPPQEDPLPLEAPLSLEINKEYNRLKKLVASIPPAARLVKKIEGTGGLVSVSDLIAYHIGWGKNIIRWYETGIKGETPVMPGDGFSTWDYTAIASYFYKNYAYDSKSLQDETFHQVVLDLLAIVEKEHLSGNLTALGVWPWCTLSSGKQWPLGKWIKVNTVAPYKRAYTLIKASLK